VASITAIEEAASVGLGQVTIFGMGRVGYKCRVAEMLDPHSYWISHYKHLKCVKTV